MTEDASTAGPASGCVRSTRRGPAHARIASGPPIPSPPTVFVLVPPATARLQRLRRYGFRTAFLAARLERDGLSVRFAAVDQPARRRTFTRASRALALA